MAKTRSQTENISVKKEEDVKPTLVLNGVSNTRSSSRIAKKKSSITNNRRVPAQQVKVEQDTDTKSLLQPPPNSSKLAKGQKISQAQINQLISFIVNDNMSIRKASQKVNMSEGSGSSYYNLYKNNPEKKIPLPRDQTPTMYTQEQIESLIRYINDDKMTITEASAKLNMTYHSGHHYYNRYLKNQNHGIPILRLYRHYTQDQKREFIHYVINDKMSIRAASKKANMREDAGREYYYKYFKEQNPDIATPSHIVTHKCYTQEQIKELFNYIADDKMNIKAASKKMNMSYRAARRYYGKYLRDNNIKTPVHRNTKPYSQDKKKEFIGYIVVDKMSINAASKKANIHYNTGKVYYRKYRKDHHLDVPTLNIITQDQKSEFIGYIVHDKMTIKAASKKANMSVFAGYKYYGQYRKNQKRDVPTRCPRVARAPQE